MTRTQLVEALIAAALLASPFALYFFGMTP